MESFRSPLQAEFRTGHFVLAITLAVFILILVLFLTNTRLHAMVRQYTRHLKESELQLQISQRQEAIGHLAGGLAHDFNNLLMPIMYYTADAIDTVGTDSAIGRQLGMSLKAAEQAKELTGQLLTLAREKVTETRLLDLNELIESFEHIIRPVIRENIDLRIQLAKHRVPIHANPSQIQQVLLNLVINAQEAMPKEGTLTIQTSDVYLDAADCRQCPGLSPGRYVSLIVSDTGVGMDDEVKLHLYEPFFTTKSRCQGTGLGLATVYGIVRQHGGCIRLESEVGRGTTFTVYFPYTGEEEVPVPVADKPADHEMVSATVLVVEDDERVRDIVTNILRKDGYDVHQAEDTNDALSLASRMDRLDLIITDVVMPGMNGRALYERVAEMRSNVDVLYISGYTEGVLSDHGIDSKHMNLLVKPFTSKALLEKVREILKGVL